MDLDKMYDFGQLKNEAESMVVDELGRQLEDVNETVCLCEDCILDMATYALNNVKPVYRVSLLGSLYTKSMENTAYKSSVNSAVTAGIEKVAANPSHDVGQND